MLIPSIDLQNGHVVQLVQGEKLAIEAPDPEPWIERFARVSARAADRPRCRARARATTRRSSRTICGRLPCRVGGGIRSVERARDGARRRRARGHRQLGAVSRRRGRRRRSPRALADAIGAERVIAAVDSRGGQVVIHGWKTVLPITAVEAVRALEPYCARVPLHPRRQGRADAGHRHGRHPGRARAPPPRRVTAAGGITTWDEIDRLDAAGVDAVVGMAIYTGQLPLIVVVGSVGSASQTDHADH